MPPRAAKADDVRPDALAQTPEAAAEVPRRGRRAAVTVATTVSTAAVLAAAVAAPADAAGRYAVWNRVANCESSNHWHINTGNGYYGGLQFSSSTWAAYGGHRYAPEASQASRREQIEVARRVLAAQGPGAWPVCGPRAGLTRASGHATHAALPREAGHHHAGKAGHHGARKHAKHPTHAARHHAAHRSSHHDAQHHARKTRRNAHSTYRVRSGDTLTSIARRLGVAGGWHALFRANRQHVHNADVLHVGQLLRLP
jgi:nucleoid-associated protein YgaU